MNGVRTALTLVVLIVPVSAGAQPPGTTQPGLASPPEYAVKDLTCAPFLTTTLPNQRFQVTGSQDTVVKGMMGPGDTLIVNAGAEQGLQAGQEFLVRRFVRHLGALGPDLDHPLDVHTSGWIKITAVAPTFAMASITHACEGIVLNDYLEPYAPPLVAVKETDGTPRFENLGHILTGDENRATIGIGEFTTIDRGSDHGIINGQRFSVYRDKHTASGPLVEIGMIVTVSVRPESSTVRVIQARDAIRRGDLVAIRR